MCYRVGETWLQWAAILPRGSSLAHSILHSCTYLIHNNRERDSSLVESASCFFCTQSGVLRSLKTNCGAPRARVLQNFVRYFESGERTNYVTEPLDYYIPVIVCWKAKVVSTDSNTTDRQPKQTTGTIPQGTHAHTHTRIHTYLVEVGNGDTKDAHCSLNKHSTKWVSDKQTKIIWNRITITNITKNHTGWTTIPLNFFRTQQI